MEKASKKVRMLAISMIKKKNNSKYFKIIASVLDECSLINVKRAYYLSLIPFLLEFLILLCFLLPLPLYWGHGDRGLLFATLYYLFFTWEFSLLLPG